MFKAEVKSCTNFSHDQQQTLEQSIEKLNKIFNSREFEDKVIHNVCPLTGRMEFAESLGLTNIKIYDRIMSGADFYLELDHDRPLYKAVGYTYPEGKVIYTYKHWFDKYAKKYYPAHLAHEWCHKKGFDHTSWNKSKWKHTVPYRIGEIVEGLTND